MPVDGMSTAYGMESGAEEMGEKAVVSALGRLPALLGRGRAGPFIAPALAVLCAINVLPLLMVDRRFFLPFSRRPPEHAAAIPRRGQLHRFDDGSRHLGAFHKHRRDDRHQRFHPARYWRAAGFSVSSPVSGSPPSDDAGIGPDAAFDGRGRDVFQSVLRSNLRHRQRVRPPLHGRSRSRRWERPFRR